MSTDDTDMSATDEPDDQTVPIDQQVDSLSRMVENLERRVATLEDERNQLADDLEDVRGELREEREARHELEGRLEQQTSLLARADEMDGWDHEKYAAYIVQKLVSMCDQADYKRKSVDAATAHEWLNERPHRTSMYDIFELAESKCDGPVQYITEPRHSDRSSRLELDVTAGGWPTRVGSHPITRCGTSTTEMAAVGGDETAAEPPQNGGM